MLKQDNKKKRRDKAGNKESDLRDMWKDLQKKLQEVAEEYKNLRTEIGDIDVFIREVVNNVIVLLQEIHESLSILEDKVAALERGVPPSSMGIQQNVAAAQQVQGSQPQQEVAAPLPVETTKPKTEMTLSSEPVPTSRQEPVTQTMPQQQKPAMPVPATSVRTEIISQLKQVLEKRKRRIKR